MSETLYLDTARLGLMSPTAQRLQNSFARLAGDPHGLLYFDEFLTSGCDGCPKSWRFDHPDLNGWRGLDGLAQSVRSLTRAPSTSEVLFASRSATLMRVATQHLRRCCHRVLFVDLLWPPYRRIFTEACRNSPIEIVICPLRTESLHKELSGDALASRITDAFMRNGCDGLVLPLIDHRGVTLPVDKIAGRLRESRHGSGCVVVDASQALGHVPIDVPSLGCHFLVAGAHKWVGGYHPLGIAVSTRTSSAETKRLIDTDPTLRLSQEAMGAVSARHGETAAILPLLTAAGAIADLGRMTVEQRLSVRQANRQKISQLLDSAGWRPMRPLVEQHGILLAKPPPNRQSLADRVDSRPFVERGVTATKYANGLVRFSMPSLPFDSKDLNQLFAALSDPSWASAPRAVA